MACERCLKKIEDDSAVWLFIEVRKQYLNRH